MRAASHHFKLKRDRRGRHLVCNLDGDKVAGPFGQHHLAAAHRDKLEIRAARKQRRCITCSTSFMSRGAGNRMCRWCLNNRTSAGPQWERF